MNNVKRILVTGGAGYVGAVLVPQLLENGYEVTVLDLYLYGDDVLAEAAGNPGLTQVKGDLRDRALLERVLPGHDAVIHLACISNDPSYDLNPELGKSINFDAFTPLVDIAKANGCKRFLYASSSSVYGIKDEEKVTEDLPLQPLTDYSKYKALCEEILLERADDGFVCTVIRPSTVCGYSPRLRLDLTVNILTNHAINNGRITVFGGQQMRPNLHIKDMAEVYLFLLDQPAERVQKKIYNVGYQNHTVLNLAEIVRKELGGDAEIVVTPSNDLRSYRVCSDKIADELGYVPRHTIEDAVRELRDAFQAGKIPDSLSDPRYFNIKLMQEIHLK